MEFDKSQQEKALQQAQSMADEFDPEEAEAFAQKHTGARWYDDFVLLYHMITDKNFTISKTAYLTIAGALAYVILPIDIIPDFIPGVGWLDDLFVIGMVKKSITEEMKRYRSHAGEVGHA